MIPGLTVTGQGFAAGETVTVSYTVNLTTGGSQTLQVTTQAQANGSFLVDNLPVPASVRPASTR